MAQRIQQQTLDNIRNEHKILLLSMDEPEGVNVEQVNRFVRKLVQAGEVVEENEDRSLLQELLRYWSSVINDKTGKYLVVHLYPFGHRARRNSWKVVTLVLFILTILLGGTTGFLITQAYQRTHVNGGTPTPTPTPQLVESGSIVTNVTLTCSGCNDPIHVTISTIQIDNTNGRMIWNTTLKDVTGSGHPYSIEIYDLQVKGSQTKIPAILTQTNLSGSSSQYTIQAIFAFSPFQKITYILTVVVSWNGSAITFNPVNITF